MDLLAPRQKHHKSWCMTHVIILMLFVRLGHSCRNTQVKSLDPLEQELKEYVDELIRNSENYRIIPGVDIKRNINVTSDETLGGSCRTGRKMKSLNDYVMERLEKYARSHHLAVDIPQTARFFSPAASAKSSFMAGFGFGFLAKLLLPIIVGAQLVKAVLLALFLPSIVGNLGKLLGKGLSAVSGSSGASAFGHGQEPMEEFEFKEPSPYNAEVALQMPDLGEMETSLSMNAAAAAAEKPENINRFGHGNHRISYAPYQSDNYYIKKPATKTDYKVFHKIPPSSLLLTTYDPFYSPLLSRLDAVFQKLGLGNDKSPQTERCRERLICMMYANPAKYAPYSNLVSAQLSRELNELRKPASDNPEILRFFRYMKAAKDGQDGEECLAHGGCPALNAKRPSPAMLTTFNDINKLVQARKMNA